MPDYENYRNLGNAIVKTACLDYVKALIMKDKKAIEDCESFFKGEYILILSKLDGHTLMRKCKELVERNNYDIKLVRAEVAKNMTELRIEDEKKTRKEKEFED